MAGYNESAKQFSKTWAVVLLFIVNIENSFKYLFPYKLKLEVIWQEMNQENTLTISFHKYGKTCQAHERTQSFPTPPSSFSKGSGTQGASMPSTIILLNPLSLGTHAIFRDADEYNTAFQLSQLKKSSVQFLSLVSRMPQIHPVSSDDLWNPIKGLWLNPNLWCSYTSPTHQHGTGV